MSVIELIEQLKAMPEKMEGFNSEGELVVLNTHKLAEELKKSLRNCDVGTEGARPVPDSPNICDKANLVIREFEKVATRRPDGLTVIDCECSRLECAVEELKEALGETSC